MTGTDERKELIGLISGGKDSMYNLMCAVKEGWKIVALANLYPAGAGGETDSYMYQTVGAEGIELLAAAMEVPLYRRAITGTPILQTNDYEETKGDEVEDLAELLKEIKLAHPEVKGVSAGAILSSYQTRRVESICDRLGLTPVCCLWQREQKGLLREMIESGMDAILIKVAAVGLQPSMLGKTIREAEPLLLQLQEKYDVHPCGEGGEFESFVIDSPLMKRRIRVVEYEVVMHQVDDVAPVAYLRLKKLELADK